MYPKTWCDSRQGHSTIRRWKFCKKGPFFMLRRRSGENWREVWLLPEVSWCILQRMGRRQKALFDGWSPSPLALSPWGHGRPWQLQISCRNWTEVWAVSKTGEPRAGPHLCRERAGKTCHIQNVFEFHFARQIDALWIKSEWLQAVDKKCIISVQWCR